MPQRLTIHVGYPKTGTTTLQEACFGKLTAEQFPGKAHGRMPGWLDDFRHLINYGTRPNVEAAAGDFAEVFRNLGDSVLVSLEGFTNPFVDTRYLQPKDVYQKAEHIRTVLDGPIRDGLDVRILVTVRDQVSLLPSLFAQIGVHGAAAGLFRFDYDNFLAFMLEDHIAGFGRDFCFDRYAAHCGDLFGADAVMTVLSMSDLVADRRPEAVEALAKIIPLEAAAITEALAAPKRNVRKSAEGSDYTMMLGSPIARRRAMLAPEIGYVDKARILLGRRLRRTARPRGGVRLVP